MSKKTAVIGAGSVVFCRTLMSDIMSTPALAARRTGTLVTQILENKAGVSG